MERAIGIIKREIEKRKSMLMNEEYFLQNNKIKCEIESLDKALGVVNKNYLLQLVSNNEVAVCEHQFDAAVTWEGHLEYYKCSKCGAKQTDC